MDFLRNTQAKDIMTRSVICVHPHTSIPQLLELFVKHGIAGAPVIDQHQKVVGFVAQIDIVELDLQSEEYINSRMEETGGCVEDIMVPVDTYAQETDPLAIIIDKMCTEKLHRLIVLDEHQHVSGIVTTMDIMCALQKAYKSAQ